MSLNELDPLLPNYFIFGKLVHFDTRIIACICAACASWTSCYTISATSFNFFWIACPPCCFGLVGSLQTIWRHDREVMWFRPRFFGPTNPLHLLISKARLQGEYLCHHKETSRMLTETTYILIFENKKICVMCSLKGGSSCLTYIRKYSKSPKFFFEFYQTYPLF